MVQLKLTNLNTKGNANSVLNAALGYSQILNWSVFPLHSIINGRCTCNKDCTSPGKHPRTYNGLKSATTDANIIKEWFTKWPNSNIGIATGNISGFFVLDVDVKREGGFIISNGHETLEELTDKYGKLPDTVQQISGSKEGNHHLFMYHEGIRNVVDFLPGLDIRGDGGYIVASPSIHISGHNYEWELSSKPYINEIVKAPKWLLGILQSSKETYQKKSSSYWVDLFNYTREGNRNNAAASMTGHLLKRDIDIMLVIEFMHLWNESKVRPPLKAAELDTIINSIASKELARRQGVNR